MNVEVLQNVVVLQHAHDEIAAIVTRPMRKPVAGLEGQEMVCCLRMRSHQPNVARAIKTKRMERLGSLVYRNISGT